jgi:HEAT repeat protein
MPRPKIPSRLITEALSMKSVSARDRRVWQLQTLGSREVFDRAARLCQSRAVERRELGADILAQLGYQTNKPFKTESLPILTALLADRSSAVVASAIHALGHLEAIELVPKLIPFADSDDRAVRFALATALPWLALHQKPRDREPAIQATIQLTADTDANVRNWATFGLGDQLGDDRPAIRDALAARLRDRHHETRAEALLGLAKRGDSRALLACAHALRRSLVGRLDLRSAAYLGAPELLPLLENLTVWKGEVEYEQAIERCDPAQRHRSEARWASLIAAIGERVRGRKVRRMLEVLAMKVVDRELSYELTVDWRSAGRTRRRTASWWVDGLVDDRASGDLTQAAAFVVADLVNLAV